MATATLLLLVKCLLLIIDERFVGECRFGLLFEGLECDGVIDV